MTNSLIVLGVMLAILVAGSFMRKIPVAVLLVVASIAGAVVGGMTDPLLAAKNIMELVEWSGGLYDPPAKFLPRKEDPSRR